MDMGDEANGQPPGSQTPGARSLLPRQFLGFPWFAWAAAAIYLFILFNLFAPYF